MLKDLGLLISLQNVDIELDKNKKKSEEIITQVKEADEKSEKVENNYKDKKEELKITRIKKREKEKKIDEIDPVLAKHDNEKYKIKSKQEFEALEKEISVLDNKKRETEDILLELMEKEEELGQFLPDLKEKLEKIRIELNQKKRNLKSELADVSHLIEQLREKKEELAHQLDPYHWKLYEQLRQRGEGLAVVLVKENICQGCFMKVSPSLVGQIKHQEEITHCENCNRILFFLE